MPLLETSIQVEKLFHEIQAATEQFSKSAQLSCLAGCGKCCENPEIETTVLEMLPLAFEYKKKNKLDELYEAALKMQNQICLSYQKTSDNRGFCKNYHQRPGLCRLFGFAAVRDKQNKLDFAACRPLLNAHPEKIQSIKKEVRLAQLCIPTFVDFSAQLSEIDPSMAMESLPINNAILKAIEKVSLLPSA